MFPEGVKLPPENLYQTILKYIPPLAAQTCL
jgi:hypothetical protein